MKYYGFVLNDLGNFLIGSCYSESGEFQFYETGKDIQMLKSKMEQRSEQYGMDFVFFHNFDCLPRSVKNGLYKDSESRMN